jgi:hypothetical protein
MEVVFFGRSIPNIAANLVKELRRGFTYKYPYRVVDLREADYINYVLKFDFLKLLANSCWNNGDELSLKGRLE